MNERIKGLAEQAGMNIKTNVIGAALVFGTFEGYKTSHISVEELEKFAELIVRECISAVEEDIYDTYDEWLIGHAAGLRKAKELIAKHFGIEP